MAENTTTEAAVVVTSPAPCQSCGKEWERIGFMEFELTCACPPMKEVPHVE